MRSPKINPKIVWTVIPQGISNGKGRVAIVIAPQLQSDRLKGTVLDNWPETLNNVFGKDLKNGIELLFSDRKGTSVRVKATKSPTAIDPSSDWWLALFPQDLKKTDEGDDVKDYQSLKEAEPLSKVPKPGGSPDKTLMQMAKDIREGSQIVKDHTDLCQSILQSCVRVANIRNPYLGKLDNDRRPWFSEAIPQPNEKGEYEAEEFAVVLHRYSQYPLLMRTLGLILDCEVLLPNTDFTSISILGSILTIDADNVCPEAAVESGRFIPVRFPNWDDTLGNVYFGAVDYGKDDTGLVNLKGGLAISANLQGAGFRVQAHSDVHFEVSSRLWDVYLMDVGTADRNTLRSKVKTETAFNEEAFTELLDQLPVRVLVSVAEKLATEMVEKLKTLGAVAEMRKAVVASQPSLDQARELFSKGFQGDGVSVFAPPVNRELDGYTKRFLVRGIFKKTDYDSFLEARALREEDVAQQMPRGALMPRGTLLLDDLIVGWRIDVRKGTAGGGFGPWRSLCDRSLAYLATLPAKRARDGNERALKLWDGELLTTGLNPTIREGWVGFSSMIHADPKDPNKPIRAFSDLLFRWSGWSLVARPPWEEKSFDKPDINNDKPMSEVPLKVEDHLRERRLPSLRWRDHPKRDSAAGVTYQIRARAVDLSGVDVNSYAGAFRPINGDLLDRCTITHVHLRVDAIPPPRCLGPKSNDPTKGRKPTHRLAPTSGSIEAEIKLPLATFERVVNEGLIDGLSEKEAYDLLSRLSLDGSEENKLVVDGKEVEPLTDPATDRIALVAYEGQYASTSLLPSDPNKPVELTFGPWPDPGYWTLEVSRFEPPDEANREEAVTKWFEYETVADSKTLIGIDGLKEQVVVDKKNRRLTLRVAAHWPIILQLEALPVWAHSLLAPGVFGANDEDKQNSKNVLRKGLVVACPTPWPVFAPRNLTISHLRVTDLKPDSNGKYPDVCIAKGEPRTPPEPTAPSYALRCDGSSVLNGIANVVLHVPSTGWCELNGRVYERSDLTEDDIKLNKDTTLQPSKPSRMLAARLTQFDNFSEIPELAYVLSKVRSPFSVDVGTTKRVRIAFSLMAGTAYSQDYEPKELEMRGPVECKVVLPSTAKPLKPVIADMLPVYRRTVTEHVGTEEKDDDGFILKRRIHYHTGLRLFLARPWFSSGEGEQLAVLIGSSTTDPHYSCWGNDAIQLEKTPGDNSLLKLTNGTEKVDTRDAFKMHLFDPVYEELEVGGAKAGRWMVNLDLQVPGTYFPFVQLRLARYQPLSLGEPDIYDKGVVPKDVPRMGLSDIEDCPPIQLPPEREFKVWRLGDTAKIEIIGAHPQSNSFTARIDTTEQMGRLGREIGEPHISTTMASEDFQSVSFVVLRNASEVKSVIIQESEKIYYDANRFDTRVIGSYLVEL